MSEIDVCVEEQELLESCEVIPEELEMSLERLKEFTKPYLKLLPRIEMQKHGEDFLEGLVTDLERKSVEPIAERLGQYRRPLQYFIGASPWDHQPLLDELISEVKAELGEENGILVIDPSAFPKKGTHSVGVARQWCGRLGKQDNCQLGVFLGYVSNKGHTLVDERLYMPREWAKDKTRRAKCGVPKEVRFKTALQLAVEMVETSRLELPHRWVVGDGEFGRPFWFRNKLEQMGERYLLEIPSNLSVRDLHAAAPRKKHRRGARPKVSFQRVCSWKDGLKKQDWKKIHLRDGTKGPLDVWAARTRVQTKDKSRRSKKSQWLMVTKTTDAVAEYRYYFSNAEENVSLQEMAHAANARYWIEDAFERAKGKVGLDHYEVRSWSGWHHHITLCLLALYFLVLEHRRLSQSTPPITLQQSAQAIGEILRNPNINVHSLALKITNRLRRNEHARIDHWRKFHILPPSWTIARATHVPHFTQ